MNDTQQSGDAPMGFALGAAARKIAKFYTAALQGEPVTPSQLFFLRQLWLEDGLTLVALRERAQLDATSATWLADQLEKSGLIERRRNDPDRRLVRVWLTPAGRNLHQSLGPRVDAWEASLRTLVRKRRTEAELAGFFAVLSTLIEELPDGDDLWSEIVTTWDRSFESLRAYLEAEES